MSTDAGLVIPQAPSVVKRSYASPLSFIGATRRAFAWVRKVGSTPVKAYLAWTAVALYLVLMYSFLVVYYTVVFGLFGVFMFPYRLVRRSHRKAQHLQEVQLAATQALLVQQSQIIANTASVQGT
jgi:hypothetical protein